MQLLRAPLQRARPAQTPTVCQRKHNRNGPQQMIMERPKVVTDLKDSTQLARHVFGVKPADLTPHGHPPMHRIQDKHAGQASS